MGGTTDPSGDPGGIPQITLPPILITPDDDLKPGGALTAGQGGTDQPDFSDAFDKAVAGLSDLKASAAQVAPLDVLSAHRIADRAGLPAPKPPVASIDDLPDVPPMEDVPADLRYQYARAVQNGETESAQDFAEHFAGAAWQEAHDNLPAVADHDDIAARVTNFAKSLAAALPDHQDLIDYSIGLSNDIYGEATPGTVALVKSNLLDAWQQTGATVASLVKLANTNPDFKQQLATPQPAPPPIDLLSANDAKAAGVTDLGNGIAYFGVHPPKKSAASAPVVPGEPPTVKEPQSEEPAQRIIELGNGLAYAPTPTRPEPPSQASLDAAEQNLLEQTGIPDLQESYEALHRGEGLQAVGHLGAGLANALSLFTPAKGAVKEATELGGAGIGIVGKIVGALYREHFMTQAERDLWAANQTGAEIARNTIRTESGMGRRDKQAIGAALEDYRSALSPLLDGHRQFIAETGDWARETAAAKQAWINAGNDADAFTPARPAPTLDPLQVMIDHVEQRPGGGRLAPDSPLYPVMDAIKTQYQFMRAQMEAQFPDMTSFIEDYYRHLWKSDRDFDRVMGTGKQGSGASLNQRTIPTYFDGILRGLVPKVIDPIDNLLHYVQGMRDRIAAGRIIDTARDAGQVYYDTAPRTPSDVQLSGLAAQRLRVFNDAAGEAQSYLERAYANAGFAKVYNRWIGKGFFQWPVAGAIYGKLQAASNTMTGSALGLSGYHAVNIAKEVGASGLANGIGELANRDLVNGIRDIGMSATVLPKLATNLVRGGRFQSVYFRQAADATPLENQLADIYARAGGGGFNRGAEYFAGTTKNIFRSLRDGTLGFELKEDLRSVVGSAAEPGAKRAVLTIPRAVGLAAKEFGRVTDTLSAPLFDYAIPKLKAAAWADEMEAYLRANPLAADDAILSHARTTTDSMDDRFGELVQDNLFWPKIAKQLANLGLVSVGWEYGTLRAFGRGVDDALNRRFTTRVRWLMAFPLMMAIQATAYQALKTGTLPSDWRDLMTPQTGGTLASGQPERALPPGPEKEPTQWYGLLRRADSLPLMAQAVGTYATNKENPWLRSVATIFTSRSMSDWLGKLVENASPIVLQSPLQRGSNLSGLERWLGIRQAPRAISDPDALDQQLDRKLQRQQYDDAQRAYRKDQGLDEPTGFAKPAYPSTREPKAYYPPPKPPRHR